MDSGELNSEYKRRQVAKILDCYGGDIEKGGKGSGRHRGQFVKIKRAQGTLPDERGVIHSSDKDNKYHHVKTTTGDLVYAHDKDITEANESESEDIKNKMKERKYADGKTFYSDFEKSEDLDLEKGREGSRGGKIIGHTTSGKPIYESHSHEAHKDFTFKEHNDAADLHKKEKESLDSRMKKEYHDKISDLDDDEIFGDKHKEIQKVGDVIREKRKFHEEQHYGHIDEANKKFKNM